MTTDEIDAAAIALYVKDGGDTRLWHSDDHQVRHAYRLLAVKNGVAIEAPTGRTLKCQPNDL